MLEYQPSTKLMCLVSFFPVAASAAHMDDDVIPLSSSEYRTGSIHAIMDMAKANLPHATVPSVASSGARGTASSGIKYPPSLQSASMLPSTASSLPKSKLPEKPATVPSSTSSLSTRSNRKFSLYNKVVASDNTTTPPPKFNLLETPKLSSEDDDFFSPKRESGKGSGVGKSPASSRKRTSSSSSSSAEVRREGGREGKGEGRRDEGGQ